MAWHRGQKALYEVMHKSGLKPAGSAGPLRPMLQQDADRPPEDDQDPGTNQTPSPAVRWRRPRLIQFNAGRIELTIPYPIAVAVVLALILIVVAAYRWGQSGVHGP